MGGAVGLWGVSGAQREDGGCARRPWGDAHGDARAGEKAQQRREADRVSGVPCESWESVGLSAYTIVVSPLVEFSECNHRRRTALEGRELLHPIGFIGEGANGLEKSLVL